MDRLIVYPGAIPLDTDILSVERNVMTAFGWLAQAALGTATGVAGLACTPTNPASMTVNIGPGAIWAQEVIDQNNFGSLPADASPLMKMGILPETAGTNFTMTVPLVSGQSINYLIEAAFEEVDTDPVVLPYVNPSNPSQPYSGPANSGTPQNTVRAQIVDLQLKAGVAANTGTQLTPPVDTGYIGLYVITVNYGQTTISAPNITVYPGAPFAVNITEAWIAQNFAALNGNATEVFNVATATQATHALSLGQAEDEFAALNGNAEQAFAVAPATATTQAPQLQQVETLISAAMMSVTSGVKVFKQNDIYTVSEGVTSVEVVVVGGGGGGMAPRLYVTADLQQANGSSPLGGIANGCWASDFNYGPQVVFPKPNTAYNTLPGCPAVLAKFNININTTQYESAGPVVVAYTQGVGSNPDDAEAFTFVNASTGLNTLPTPISASTGIIGYPYGGGGGAGGGFAYVPAIAVTPGQQIPITVGAGGLGEQPWVVTSSGTDSGSGQPTVTVNGYSSPPTAGGASSFGSIVTATGGGTTSYETIGGYLYNGIYSNTEVNSGQVFAGTIISESNPSLYPSYSTPGTATGPANGIYLNGGSGAVGPLWIPSYFNASLIGSAGMQGVCTSYGVVDSPVSSGGGGGGAGNGGNSATSGVGGWGNPMASQNSEPGQSAATNLPTYIPNGGAGGNGACFSNASNGQFPGGGGGGGAFVCQTPNYDANSQDGVLCTSGGWIHNPPVASNCFTPFRGYFSAVSTTPSGSDAMQYLQAYTTAGGNGAPGVVIVIEHSGS